MRIVPLGVSFLLAASCQGRPPVSGVGPGSARDGTGRPQICLEAGELLMGSPEGEPGRDPDEELRPRRITRPFLMDATEVSRRTWHQVMGSASVVTDPCGEDCPMVRVSWYDAVAWLNARSRSDGLPECYALRRCSGVPGAGCGPGEQICRGTFRCEEVAFAGLDCAGWRLPTEAEWEYAARAGTSTPFPSGSCLDGEEAVFDGLTPLPGCPQTRYRSVMVPVGTLPANPWGLHEMLGNAYEWVWDWYSPPGGSADAPGTDVTGPAVGDQRVVRGGSLGFPMSALRSGDRSAMDPDLRSDLDGLRGVRTAGPAGSSCR